MKVKIYDNAEDVYVIELKKKLCQNVNERFLQFWV